MHWQIKKHLSIPRSITFAGLMLASAFSTAAEVVTFKDRVIGFDNVDVLNTTYNVRFTQYSGELPVGGSNTLHTAKQAEVASEALIELIKQHGVPVVGRKHNIRCHVGDTCRILSPYAITSEFSNENIWSVIKRFKADANHRIISSSIRDEHTAYDDTDMLRKYTYYAKWELPEE